MTKPSKKGKGGYLRYRSENRRLKKMYIEEKLKAEIATEYFAKK